jgi:ABC-2 type transport system ATP-binding protein
MTPKEVDANVIEISNLSKVYPNQKGVRDISFSVAKGEIMGLLGPNGAGKTTTMRLITGFLGPNSGSIKVGEYDIADDPVEVRRQIGYMPENPPVYPEMSVLSYLQFAARLKGVKKSDLEAEVDRVVELTSLGGVLPQLIGSLSRGYKQRVGLAQALLNSPPVLIFDEPTIGLDPKQIIEMRNLIKNLAQEHTVILSSHILPEVNMICNKVAIIAQGRLVAVDTPEGLSRQLNSGQKVELEAKASKETIEKVLGSIKRLSNISYTGPGKNGAQESHCFTVQSDEEGDIREELMQAFAAAKILILEMHTLNLSLEEIFLQLTTSESQEVAAESEAGEDGEGKEGVANA